MTVLANKIIENKPLYSIPETAIILGASKATAQRLINSGSLESVKILSRTLIKRSSIEALIGESIIKSARANEA